MRKYYISEKTLAQNDPFPGSMGIYEDKDVAARIAELATKLEGKVPRAIDSYESGQMDAYADAAAELRSLMVPGAGK